MDFGVFIDVPGCPAYAVLLVTEFEDGDRSFAVDDYPQAGHTIEAVVVDLVDHSQQLRVSTRLSKLSSALPQDRGPSV
jgi:hypothetical protein